MHRAASRRDGALNPNPTPKSERPGSDPKSQRDDASPSARSRAGGEARGEQMHFPAATEQIPAVRAIREGGLLAASWRGDPLNPNPKPNPDAPAVTLSPNAVSRVRARLCARAGEPSRGWGAVGRCVTVQERVSAAERHHET